MENFQITDPPPQSLGLQFTHESPICSFILPDIYSFLRPPDPKRLMHYAFNCHGLHFLQTTDQA